MLVPTAMTTRYVKKDLSARYGAQELRKFVRYYVVPGYGHGRGAFNVQWDFGAALDTWVETNEAPEWLVVTDLTEKNSVAAPGRCASIRAGPCIRAPARWIGPDSFTCVTN